MQYGLKDKIEVTDEFLNELILKGWQESEVIQQQIANINASTKLGADVVGLLKNLCTSYLILVGCLEALAENTETNCLNLSVSDDRLSTEVTDEVTDYKVIPEATVNTAEYINNEYEPFEYFVDFDEPVGEPLTDMDLYR